MRFARDLRLMGFDLRRLLSDLALTERAAATVTLAAMALLGLVLAGSWSVLASGALTVGVLLARAGGGGVYADPVTLLLYSLLLVGLIAGRAVVESGRRAVAEGTELVASARERETQLQAQL